MERGHAAEVSGGWTRATLKGWHLTEARPLASSLQQSFVALQEAGQALFGGAGWAPDIPALQAWLGRRAAALHMPARPQWMLAVYATQEGSLPNPVELHALLAGLNHFW